MADDDEYDYEIMSKIWDDDGKATLHKRAVDAKEVDSYAPVLVRVLAAVRA